jgi:hypothetical protein
LDQSLRSQLLWRLSKTWVVQRLKHIDLSAVPAWLGPRVSTASRYSHSIGVGKLSLLIRDGTERDRLLLTAAAILHDVGNGPFPHISDKLMKDMLGFTHEEAVSFAFQNSPIKESSILEKCGLNPTEIASVISGQHHLSRFFLGFPDLDNADNVFRFITTIPGKPLGEASYRPSEIGASMSLEAEENRIPEDLKKRWSRDREKLYRYLWNDSLNMIGWTMLERAMRILREELTPRFFLMTNREAFNLIRLRLPKLANGLERKEFKILLDRRYSALRGEAKKLSNSTSLKKIEDELCRETGLEEWSIGLTVDQPLIREKTDHWRVYLVAHKDNGKPKILLDDMLSSSIPFLLSE